ncbi:unnamed protein product, partial [Notodromas monacha]
MTINDHQDENPIKHDWRTDYSNRPYYGDIQRELPDVDYDRDLRSAYELGSAAGDAMFYEEVPIIHAVIVFANNEAFLVKFHWTPKQGVAQVVWDEALKINGKDPDFHRRDLWDAIERGNYPEWELGAQIFSEEDAKQWDFDVLDATKLIPEELVPVTPLGRADNTITGISDHCLISVNTCCPSISGKPKSKISCIVVIFIIPPMAPWPYIAAIGPFKKSIA